MIVNSAAKLIGTAVTGAAGGHRDQVTDRRSRRERGRERVYMTGMATASDQLEGGSRDSHQKQSKLDTEAVVCKTSGFWSVRLPSLHVERAEDLYYHHRTN